MLDLIPDDGRFEFEYSRFNHYDKRKHNTHARKFNLKGGCIYDKEESVCKF